MTFLGVFRFAAVFREVIENDVHPQTLTEDTGDANWDSWSESNFLSDLTQALRALWTEETCHVTFDHGGKVPYIEGSRVSKTVRGLVSKAVRGLARACGTYVPTVVAAFIRTIHRDHCARPVLGFGHGACKGYVSQQGTQAAFVFCCSQSPAVSDASRAPCRSASEV